MKYDYTNTQILTKKTASTRSEKCEKLTEHIVMLLQQKVWKTRTHRVCCWFYYLLFWVCVRACTLDPFLQSLCELSSRSRPFVRPQIKNVWHCSCHVCGIKNSLWTLLRIHIYFFNPGKFHEYNGLDCNGMGNELILQLLAGAVSTPPLNVWICWLSMHRVHMNVC